MIAFVTRSTVLTDAQSIAIDIEFDIREEDCDFIGKNLAALRSKVTGCGYDCASAEGIAQFSLQLFEEARI